MKISHERIKEMDATLKAVKRYWLTRPQDSLGTIFSVLSNKYKLSDRNDEELVELLKTDIDSRVAYQIKQITQNGNLTEEQKTVEIKEALAVLLVASGYTQTADKLKEE